MLVVADAGTEILKEFILAHVQNPVFRLVPLGFPASPRPGLVQGEMSGSALSSLSMPSSIREVYPAGAANGTARGMQGASANKNSGDGKRGSKRNIRKRQLMTKQGGRPSLIHQKRPLAWTY